MSEVYREFGAKIIEINVGNRSFRHGYLGPSFRVI